MQDHLHQLRLHPRLLRPLTSAPHAPFGLAGFDPQGSAIEPLANAAVWAAEDTGEARATATGGVTGLKQRERS